MPPDFLNIKLDAATQVNWSVLLIHTEPIVMVECLEGGAVVPHVFEAPLDDDQVLIDLRRRPPIPAVSARPPTQAYN
jgi:hypothetical protein